MSTTYSLDTATSRAHPVPEPVRRLTVPAIQGRKVDGVTAEPLVMLTAYTARMAQLLDPHCDLLLVGDSLGQVIYGLDTTVRVTLDMMVAHAAAVVRGSYRSVVVVDLPFGTYEASAEQAFATSARVMRETGAAARQRGTTVCRRVPYPFCGRKDRGRPWPCVGWTWRRFVV